LNTQTYWDDAAIDEYKVDPIQSNDLLKLTNYYQSDKGNAHGPRHDYAKYYQRYFYARRRQKLRVLEIGIARGSSLKTWASFFPNSYIEGIDINPNCRTLCEDFENVEILIGDAKTYDFEDRVFDIIVDDGSHLARDIIATWSNLEKNVHGETIYVVEDIHATFDKAYVEAFYAKRRLDENLAEWLADNGWQKLNEFFIQISDTHKINFYEDKIAFITRRAASGASGDDISFSFGENWLNLIDSLDQDTLDSAAADIKDWIDVSWIKNKNVIDIGSGSGLSSLSFKQAGCGDLTSIDVDPSSVSATLKLAQSHPVFIDSWNIQEASILNDPLIESLPKYDLVYSWGVLHHTGQMWRAIDNAAKLCKSGGLIWLSIYTGGHKYREDLELKQAFNAADVDEKKQMIQAEILKEQMHLEQMGSNPEDWNRKKERGMNVYNDIVDWLGGLPYEVARVSEMLVFFQQKRFVPLRVLEDGPRACSIYLFKKLSSKDFADCGHQTFIYNRTRSKFTTKRTIMQQINSEFQSADSMYSETGDLYEKRQADSLSRVIEAEGRMNSGRHLAELIMKWAKRKFTRN